VATREVLVEWEQNVVTRTPMGRRGTPDEIRGLALYLASDASRFVTGQVFVQDGGWTAQ
jgi:NAD(P)-dependent dehydrogenase (short-subunit alcohol dehydrogenase family)